MHRPIVIPMEDELIHTRERPYCNDPACPCHTTGEEVIGKLPRSKNARRDARRKRGGPRRQKKGQSRR
jgi:hypothetical protein